MSHKNLFTRLADTPYTQEKIAMKRQILQRIEGKKIRSLAALPWSPSKKIHTKREILARITHPTAEGSLADLKRDLSPQAHSLARLRTEILGRIAVWQPVPVGQLWTKRLAVAAVLLFVMRLAPMLVIAEPIQASSSVTLIPTDGPVNVIKGPGWRTVDEAIEISEPMTVRGPATIASDTRVLRLAENSEVVLRAAFFEPPHSENRADAYVSYGEVWVASLLPELLQARAKIITPHGIVLVKEGSVNIIADPQQTTAQVFHRFAEVVPTNATKTRLIEGEQLVLSSTKETQRHQVTSAMRSREWVMTNLSRDAVHRTDVVERNQELAEAAAGILPTSTFYTLKRASEQFDLFFTLGKDARNEKHIRNAQTRINEAVALLAKGETAAAADPLAAYREAIAKLASLTEAEATNVLTQAALNPATVVASALPHSPLYPVKETLVETTTEHTEVEIDPSVFLLGDALLEIQSRIARGTITEAADAYAGIEGAVATVLDTERLGEIDIEKGQLQAIKTIVRSIAYSLEEARATVGPDQVSALNDLSTRISGTLPSPQPITVAEAPEAPCMTVREVTRTINRFLSSVYTYESPVGQRNEVIRQIALLPDCRQSGRVLAKVWPNLPVATRSIAWDALQKIDTEL